MMKTKTKIRKKKLIYVYSKDKQKVLKVKSNKSADKILGEDSPEYTVDCPKCGCRFGVN